MDKRTTAMSGAGALLLLGCLVLLNLLSQRFYARADFSEGRLYSLSPGSRRVLAGLSAEAEIRVFFSKELPPEYAANRSFFRDLLGEYESASGGKVRARFIDLEADEKGREEALKEGIAPVQFNVVSKEKYEVREGFMGLSIRIGDKKEVLPVLADASTFEYDLTSRLLQMTRTERTAIGIVSSHGAIGPGDLDPRTQALLSRHYEMKPVDLGALPPGATVPSDIGALLVLGPTRPLPDTALYALDQFLVSGRPAVFALDARESNLRSFIASPLDAGLRKLLAAHGVRLRQNFVLDAQNQPVQISQRRGIFSFASVIPYPLFVLARDLNEEHPVTRGLGGLTLPMAAPLVLSTAAAPGTEAAVLARSSKFSWVRSGWERGVMHSINPMENFEPTGAEEKGPFALAAALTGTFKSVYSKERGSKFPLPEGASAAAHLAEGIVPGRFLVVGTSRFAASSMPMGESSVLFLMNLVDWSAMDTDLISIRNKGTVFRPLREIPPASKTLLKWTNILTPVFLVAAFGLARLRRRRKNRLRREALYL